MAKRRQSVAVTRAMHNIIELDGYVKGHKGFQSKLTLKNAQNKSALNSRQNRVNSVMSTGSGMHFRKSLAMSTVSSPTNKNSMKRNQTLTSSRKVLDIKNLDFGLAAESLFETHHQDFSVANNDSTNIDFESELENEPDLYDLDTSKRTVKGDQLLKNRFERQHRKNKNAFIIYPEN